jgi:hypothetical protein
VVSKKHTPSPRAALKSSRLSLKSTRTLSTNIPRVIRAPRDPALRLPFGLLVRSAISGRQYRVGERSRTSVANRCRPNACLKSPANPAHRTVKLYLEAIDYAFSGMIDYAMLVKIYGSDPEGEKRYSPAKCIGCETRGISGSPRSEAHQHQLPSSARISPFA